MLAGTGIRRRLRSTLALALLVGIVAAVVCATAAGARRSGTSLDRFNSFSRSSTLEISIGIATPRQLREFRATRGVEATSVLEGYALNYRGNDDLAIAGPLDGAIGHTIDRARLIEGRRANPNAAG